MCFLCIIPIAIMFFKKMDEYKGEKSFYITDIEFNIKDNKIYANEYEITNIISSVNDENPIIEEQTTPEVSLDNLAMALGEDTSNVTEEVVSTEVGNNDIVSEGKEIVKYIISIFKKQHTHNDVAFFLFFVTFSYSSIPRSWFSLSLYK